ncbi:MAG: carbohydrate ABC transporter permease [Treponema sp.]|nr:carbohydrate ABC transporter permease [Treponema sp.]
MTSIDRFFARRYLIHIFMILLALIAVIPIYVLLINATRSTEQINTGLTMLPGSNAFWSSTNTIYADWGKTDDAEEIDPNANYYVNEGTVVFMDLLMGITLKEVENPKTGAVELRVVKALTESRQPRIVIADNEGDRLALYVLSDQSTIYVNNGQRIEKGTLVAKTIVPASVAHNWRALTGRGFQIWQGFGNSAFISVTATILSVYFSAMTAYGLHIYRFKGRKVLWTVILIIMMLPGSLTFIGFYQFMARIRLLNSYVPLILPGIAAAATVLFIRQYMMAILSLELIDSARIDGASEYRIFNVIVLPVIVPALATQSIFTFVGTWNNFITPFVLISSMKKYTLPMLVQSLRGDIYRTEMGGIYLGIAVSLVPILVFYAFMSRFIISGITLGSIKE